MSLFLPFRNVTVTVGGGRRAGAEPPGVAQRPTDGPQRYATPLQIETRLGIVSFLNTTTVFGTPTEVTLSELALEMLFPADPATIAIVKAMVEEEAAQAIESGLQKAG